MIVENKVGGWITVNDINLQIPPNGKGGVFVDDKKGVESKELAALVKQNLVSVKRDTISIRPGQFDDRKVYIVPSNNVWGSASGLDKRVSEASYDFNAQRKEAVKVSKSENRRYKIRKIVDHNIAIQVANIVLNKENPAMYVSSEHYYSEEIQKAILHKFITLECVEGKMINDDGGEKWDVINEDSINSIDDALAPRDKPCVFWEGPIFDGGGYANMNRQYLFNLEELGIHVKPSLVPTLMDVEESIKEKLIGLSYNIVPLQSPKVYATNVPNSHIGRSISYTMMETEEKIHDSLVHKLMIADEIWVPCEWNKTVFQNSGIKKEINVMPLGVEHDLYKPEEQSVFFESGTKKFTFISVFNWNWRKGFDVMLKAYARAFSSKDDVSLVMVSRFIGQKQFSDRIYSDIRSIISEEREGGLPHLVLVDDVIPTYLMPRLYNSADAFVLFSRGEGWGLPYCEAASSGIPIIGADHGGQQMFLDDSVAALVKPDKVVDVNESIKWISPFYHGMKFVDYSEKAINEASDKMRWMYENREEAQAKADLARERILNNFTWKHAAERVAKRIREIQP